MRLIFFLAMLTFLVSCGAPPKDKSFHIDELMNQKDYHAYFDSINRTKDSLVLNKLRHFNMGSKFICNRNTLFESLKEKNFDFGGEKMVIMEWITFRDILQNERYTLTLECKERQVLRTVTTNSGNKNLNNISLEQDYHNAYDFSKSNHTLKDEYHAYKMWLSGRLNFDNMQIEGVGMMHFYSWNQNLSNYHLDSTLFYAVPGVKRY